MKRNFKRSMSVIVAGVMLAMCLGVAAFAFPQDATVVFYQVGTTTPSMANGVINGTPQYDTNTLTIPLKTLTIYGQTSQLTALSVNFGGTVTDAVIYDDNADGVNDRAVLTLPSSATPGGTYPAQVTNALVGHAGGNPANVDFYFDY